MTNSGQRTDATLALIKRKLEEQRCAIDGLSGMRTLTLLVRYDRRSGQPETVNVRPEVETT